jgi:predicted HNH restriction endonuclease
VQPSAPDRGILPEEEEDIWRESSSDRAELRKLDNVITNSVSTTKIENNNISPEEEDFPEGKVLYGLHRTRERNRELVKKAKDKRKKEAGVLKCDVCQFNFFEKYGDIGADYIECHHTKPVSELEDSDKTQLKDIALVCANCHRMLHRKRPWLSIEQLKGLLKSR